MNVTFWVALASCIVGGISVGAAIYVGTRRVPEVIYHHDKLITENFPQAVMVSVFVHRGPNPQLMEVDRIENRADRWAFRLGGRHVGYFEGIAGWQIIEKGGAK